MLKKFGFNHTAPAVIVPAQPGTPADAREWVQSAQRVLAADPTLFQIVEWRVDALADRTDSTTVLDTLKQLGKPVLATLRTVSEGGAAAVSGADYAAAVTELCALAPELIDIELRTGSETAELVRSARSNGIETVVSLHDWQGTPSAEELTALWQELLHTGADVLKLAVTAENPADVERLRKSSLELCEKHPEVTVIAIAMGEPGEISRLEPEAFGSVATFAALDKPSAPGQHSVYSLRDYRDCISS